MENNKTQRGRARSVPPLWGGAEGAALLFSIHCRYYSFDHQVQKRPPAYPKVDRVSGPKVARKLAESWLKVARKLPGSCPKVARKW